jgi:hypothetical protein
MKDNGKTISKMVTVLRLGPMAPDMKDTIKLERSMDKVYINEDFLIK